MKSFVALVLLIGGTLLLLQSGCDLLTKDPDTTLISGGGDLVINEVFTLPPDRFYAFSWIELLNPTLHPVNMTAITLPATAYATGANGTFLKTDDDGLTWTSYATGSAVNFTSMSFPKLDSGVVVGDNGTLFKVVSDSVSGFRFIDRSFLSPTPGTNYNAVGGAPGAALFYIVGDGGTILRSPSISQPSSEYLNNVGREVSNTTNNLNAVYVKFVGSPIVIYVVGDSSTILRQKNVSGPWVRQFSPHFNVSYHGVVAVDSSAWIVGDGGSIAYTRNLGDLWRARTAVGVTANLRSVFASKNEGMSASMVWACGDGGTIIRSQDSGKTWEAATTPTTANLYNITFTTPERGFAFGDNGVALSSFDGGSTWSNQSSGVNGSIQGSQFFQLSTVISNAYFLCMTAVRERLFFDQTTGILNPNFITARDTGIVDLLLPTDNSIVAPRGFVVVASDSGKFRDHFNYGPGDKITYAADIVAHESLAVKNGALQLFTPGVDHWKLPSAGEIRLEKVFLKQTRSDYTNHIQRYSSSSIKVIDLVRWGGYRPPAGIRFLFGADSLLYLNNSPAGRIPEWSSLSRYANQLGGPVNQSNSATSFYMAETPTPAWYSQLSSK